MNIINLICVLTSGSLLPFAFSPFNFWPFAFISMFLLLYALLNKSNWLEGLFFGLTFFGLGASWVFVSIHHYGHASIMLASFITLLFIITLSLFPAAQFYLAQKLPNKSIPLFALFNFPAAFTLLEILRSYLFTGFPWLLLGNSQTNSIFGHLGAVIGVFGVSFCIAFTSGVIYCIFFIRSIIAKLSLFLLLLIITAAAYYCYKTKFTTVNPQEINIAMIQANIDPEQKFELDNPFKTIIDTYGAMTASIIIPTDIIIWPENSVPLPLELDHNFMLQLKKFAESGKFSLLFGMPSPIKDNPKHFYNSIRALGPEISTNSVYHKQNLVPFGEYLPFARSLSWLIEDIMHFPMSSFTNGINDNKSLKLPKTNILPLICYEIAYPDLVRDNLIQSNAELITTITEEGWFGKSWGPKQHLQIAQMRAIETGRYIARATTNGISAIIDDKGKIIDRSPQFEPYILQGVVYNASGATPWMRIGLLPIIACLFLFYAIGNIGSRREL